MTDQAPTCPGCGHEKGTTLICSHVWHQNVTDQNPKVADSRPLDQAEQELRNQINIRFTQLQAKVVAAKRGTDYEPSAYPLIFTATETKEVDRLTDEVVQLIAEARKGYEPELPNHPACCKNKDGWGYAKEICDLARQIQGADHHDTCAALAKLADDQHSTGIKNGRFGYVPQADVDRAVEEVELKLLRSIENMGEGEAKRQGVFTAHNMDAYHRAYGEAVSHNVHARIAQLTPPHNPTQPEPCCKLYQLMEEHHVDCPNYKPAQSQEVK